MLQDFSSDINKLSKIFYPKANLGFQVCFQRSISVLSLLKINFLIENNFTVLGKQNFFKNRKCSALTISSTDPSRCLHKYLVNKQLNTSKIIITFWHEAIFAYFVFVPEDRENNI